MEIIYKSSDNIVKKVSGGGFLPLMLVNKAIVPISIVFANYYKQLFNHKNIKKTLYLVFVVALNNSLDKCDNDIRGPVWICSCIRSN